MAVPVTDFAPATHEQRPERPDWEDGFFERLVHRLSGRLLLPFAGRPFKYYRIVPSVKKYGNKLERLSDQGLKSKIHEISITLKTGGLDRRWIIAAFACIREAASRTVGMKHYGSQIAGGYAMLCGMVAEMDTGEGKTLTATLTAGTAALAGIPVHVISVNDYLTQRDAEIMGPVYEFCGLSTGFVIHDMELPQRRNAYGCDITYCTNKELTFDYLKDKLVLKDRHSVLNICSGYLKGEGSDVERLMMRGLHFAIVDEADSVLIDEARTPLIISRSVQNEDASQFYREALDIASNLVADQDYTITRKEQQIRLTDNGKQAAKARTKGLNPLWESQVRREEFITSALSALIFFKRDEQYIVRDDKVVIIDEFTGRVMADRSWEKGLHQLIETKENCELTDQKETLARLSYQKFFRKYQILSGMTGTAKEVRRELWNVYHLATAKIAPHKPRIRRRLTDRIHRTLDGKWRDVVHRVIFFHGQHRPVLIGTKSVADSEHLGKMLRDSGMSVNILNARQDKEEARIIASAGNAGTITVATNMAGRGTDIKLPGPVVETGGLHVILTQRHDAGRIDRQLEGRCGRQGEPGTFEAIVSLEDDIIVSGFDKAVSHLIKRLKPLSSLVFHWAGKWWMKRIQKTLERKHARIRKEVFRQDSKQDKMLSFSGRFE